MTKRRQTPAIAGCHQAPRPVAVLRESGAECIGTPGLRRRGRENPSCRDGPQLSSLWYRPGGFCHPQAVREPERCRATKAFAAPAARRGPAEAWNLTRKLRTLSSFQMRPTQGRPPQKNTIREDAMHCKLTWHKVLHKSCRDPEIVLQIPNGSQSLGELGALEWRVKVRSHCRGLLS